MIKHDVAQWLFNVDVGNYNLEECDVRLFDYVNECRMCPDNHNFYELLSVKRFFVFLGRYDFRVNEVKKFIAFYEYLKFAGKKGRTRYKLTPIQVFQFANILGFYDKVSGKRVCREALLFVPRKFSKTTSVSSLAIYDFMFGDANAQAYVGANSYDQAQVCFKEIKACLQALDPKMKHFKVNREAVYHKDRRRTSFCRCLASNPTKLDGLNASLVILDEFSQADNADLKNVLTSSMGNRDNPLTIVITTASSKLDTPFIKQLALCKRVLKSDVENDSIFAHIFEPDDNDDYGDPHTWRKVQPHLGVTVQPDFYRSEWMLAVEDAEKMVEFKTKLLNLFTKGADGVWYTSDIIDRFTHGNVKIPNIRGKPPCMVAVDLSVRDDFSAVCYNIYDKKEKRFHCYIDYYIPEELLKSHANRVRYKQAVEDGHLKVCKGDSIDYAQIVGDITENAKYLTIMKIGYDAYKSQEFINLSTNKFGKKYLEAVSQTYGAFTSPVEMMELAISRDQIVFDDNAMTRFCFNNVYMDEDRQENRKPIKRSANEKIDGVITAIMTLYLYNNINS